jgi:hypothetical protein
MPGAPASCTLKKRTLFSREEAHVDDTGQATDLVTSDRAEPASQEPTGLTKRQGVVIIVLLSALLTVGIVLIFLLLWRGHTRHRRFGEYLGSRAHTLADLAGREFDDLRARTDALRLEAWESKLGELLRAPRSLAARF